MFQKTLIMLMLTPFVIVGQSLPSSPTPSRIASIAFSGGSGQDQAVARLAFGIRENDYFDEQKLVAEVQAIQFTDRFKSVVIESAEGNAGTSLIVRLVSWPRIKDHHIDPSSNSPLKKALSSLPIGRPFGDFELQNWKIYLQNQCLDAGYSSADVSFERNETDETIVWSVRLGALERLEVIEIPLREDSIGVQQLKKATGISLGEVWKSGSLAETRTNVEKFLVDEGFLQATLKMEFRNGTLTIDCQPGTKYAVSYDGIWLGPLFGTRSFKFITGMNRLFDPDINVAEIIKERLDKYCKDNNFYAATITVEERLEGILGQKSSRQTLRYRVNRGPKFTLGSIMLVNNQFLDAPRAQQIIDNILRQSSVKSLSDQIDQARGSLNEFYRNHGFADTVIRYQVEADNKNALLKVIFTVREGTQQQIRNIVVQYPSGVPLTPSLVEQSLQYLLQQAMRDHQEQRAKISVALQGDFSSSISDSNLISIGLGFNQLIPLSSIGLAGVIQDLRLKLSFLGALTPRIENRKNNEGDLILFIPLQPFDRFGRLVIRGLYKTNIDALLGQINFVSNAPLDPSALVEARLGISRLNAFDEVDLGSLKSLDDDALLWKRGDMGLILSEKPNWNFTQGFGYDRTQGYYFLFGAQRNNVNGQGRTLDFNIRAGDRTIQSKTLREWFSSGLGQSNRSIDSYSIAYTDPLPAFMKGYFSGPVNWRNQIAYLEEAQAAYIARRRLGTSELDWRLGDSSRLRAGIRFEETSFIPTSPQINLQDFLLSVVRTNKSDYRIAAPYVQWIRDQRDRPNDPRTGSVFSARIDLATQLTGTSSDSSFIKMDIRYQYNYPLGITDTSGILSALLRVGVARPTANRSQELPLSERFYGGGPNSVRGVESDYLGPVVQVGLRNSQGQLIPGAFQYIPTGGEIITVLNLEYRFPLYEKIIWAEFFVDSGQVYSKINPSVRSAMDPPPFPSWRTTAGVGLIFKLGIPIKVEYGFDMKRILGRTQTQLEQDTERRGILISTGFQF